MHLARLSLTNFRNYASLELSLGPGVVALYGDNGQGKTNLLEAAFLLATTKSPRASVERELFRWDALNDFPPYVRLEADVSRADGTAHVELAMQLVNAEDGGQVVQKRLTLNGLPKRASDFVGEVNAVLFTSLDVDLVSGPPSERRRYLDLAISQMDRAYLKALQRYQRILLQRNHLLRMIGEGHAKEGELEFWDGEMISFGSQLLQRRVEVVRELDTLAREAYRAIAEDPRSMRLRYESAVEAGETLEATQEGFRRALDAARTRERRLMASLVGPHRDDLAFHLAEMPLGTYGSRGEQRSAALALRLGQAQLVQRATEDDPILLLDDILSELDPRRRSRLLELASRFEQVILTATELDRIDAQVRRRAQTFRVESGTLVRHNP